MEGEEQRREQARGRGLVREEWTRHASGRAAVSRQRAGRAEAAASDRAGRATANASGRSRRTGRAGRRGSGQGVRRLLHDRAWACGRAGLGVRRRRWLEWT